MDEDIEKAWGINHLIRQGRLRLGLSEQAFAAAVGVSRGAVQQWEKPGGSVPRRVNQPRVAEVLGITVGQLMADGPRVSAIGPAHLPRVPLLPTSEAAYFLDIDNFHDVDGHETVPVAVPVKRHTFAVKVTGDAMVSLEGDSFPDGSILVVEPEIKAQPRDYVVAVYDSHPLIFRQLIKEDALYLAALNRRYPVKPLGNAVIVGVVRAFTKYFR